MPKEPSEKLRSEWLNEIERNGEKSLRVSVLLDAFGAKRRGRAIWERIEAWCQSNGLHINGLDDEGRLTTRVKLTKERIVRVGQKLFAKEEELAKRFEVDVAHKLGGLKVIQQEYSPHGSRDKLDFLCEDPEGRAVVVELKRAGGESDVVGQVLGYMGQLQRDPTYANKNLRGIIVTGEGDPKTRRALEALIAREPGHQIEWYVYGLEGDRILVERQEIRASTRVQGSPPGERPAGTTPARRSGQQGVRTPKSRASKQPCVLPAVDYCSSVILLRLVVSGVRRGKRCSSEVGTPVCTYRLDR